MSFGFEPAANAPAWTRERYEAFLNRMPDYPNQEQMVRQGIKVEGSKRGRLPKVKEMIHQVVAVRAFTEDGLRAFHLAPDELVVNYLWGGEKPYPGFETLLDEAMVFCKRYVECYHPLGVVKTDLHYVDIVEIPVPESGVVATEKYLTLNVQAPQDVFGPFSVVELKTQFRPPGSQAPVELLFATEPVGEGDVRRRLRLEWHTTDQTGSRLTQDVARANLLAAHERLEKCFRHAFTPDGWALFEPDTP